MNESSNFNEVFILKGVNRLQEDQVQLLEELSDLSDVSAANPAPAGLTQILEQLTGDLHPSGDNSELAMM